MQQPHHLNPRPSSPVPANGTAPSASSNAGNAAASQDSSLNAATLTAEQRQSGSEEDAMEAVRRQAGWQLADLEAHEAQQQVPPQQHLQQGTPQNLNHTDQRAAEGRQREAPHQPQPPQQQPQQPQEPRPQQSQQQRSPSANASLDDEEDEDEEEDEESSSELELTIPSRPATTAAPRAPPPSSTSGGGVGSGGSGSGGSWKAQQQSNRDLRSWQVFRGPRLNSRLDQDGRRQQQQQQQQKRHNRRRRNSTDCGISDGSNSSLGWSVDASPTAPTPVSAKPAAFSQVAERNSVGLGAGLRDLAVAQLRRLRPVNGENGVNKDGCLVRLPKVQFESQLTAECQLGNFAANASAGSAAFPAAPAATSLPSARRRTASWAFGRR